MNARRCSGRDVRFIARPPAQIRTCGFPAYGLYGTFFVKGASRHFCGALLLHSLQFDFRIELECAHHRRPAPALALRPSINGKTYVNLNDKSRPPIDSRFPGPEPGKFCIVLLNTQCEGVPMK
jgi:hypothetical protein